MAKRSGKANASIPATEISAGSSSPERSVLAIRTQPGMSLRMSPARREQSAEGFQPMGKVSVIAVEAVLHNDSGDVGGVPLRHS